MRFAYPATLEPEGGGFVVSFRDVPGANTEGDDEADALAEAQDALVVALGHHIEPVRRACEVLCYAVAFILPRLQHRVRDPSFAVVLNEGSQL